MNSNVHVLKENESALDQHTRSVMKLVKIRCVELGLVDLLPLFMQAAEWHDLGKVVEPRSVNQYWRHELLSLQILEDEGITIDPLVAHLIGTHHGYWRPYAPIMTDKEVRPLKLTHLGKNYTSKKMFGGYKNPHIKVLNEQYGKDKLVFLESVFRSAIHTPNTFINL